MTTTLNAQKIIVRACAHANRKRSKNVAYIPSKGEAIREGGKRVAERVLICADCGTLLVPDGVLVDQMPHIFGGSDGEES